MEYQRNIWSGSYILYKNVISGSLKSDLQNATTFQFKNKNHTIIRSSMSWYEARSYCKRTFGSDLSCFSGSNLNDVTEVVKGKLPRSDTHILWIGLYRNPWYIQEGT